MGNQGHTHEGLRYIQEWTKAGVIGDVVEVLHWTNRPIWPQGEVQRRNVPFPPPWTTIYGWAWAQEVFR